MNRRSFLKNTLQTGVGLSVLGANAFNIPSNLFADSKGLFFKISLAEWSLHNALFQGEMTNLDFAQKSRSLNCEGLEYVNAFFKDKAKDISYLNELNSRANSEGQTNVLIMIDGEGNLADANDKKRIQGIENHFKWVDAAHHMNCHAIRVNLAGGKNKSDAIKASIDSLEKLSAYASQGNINILVENHGGFSSDGKWMQSVFSQVNSKNCGTLPDFGNFCIERGSNNTCKEGYDRYLGTSELMPYAKAISAKTYAFDKNGQETTIDYSKMLKMVKDSGYKGFIGIEFEGTGVS
ncbi:MAG: TIM barrel protein, partial [Flavobacteriales bacterium]|nr:TIM barrel protein [Flavobacteriales bacterium]